MNREFCPTIFVCFCRGARKIHQPCPIGLSLRVSFYRPTTCPMLPRYLHHSPTRAGPTPALSPPVPVVVDVVSCYWFTSAALPPIPILGPCAFQDNCLFPPPTLSAHNGYTLNNRSVIPLLCCLQNLARTAPVLPGIGVFPPPSFWLFLFLFFFCCISQM